MEKTSKIVIGILLIAIVAVSAVAAYGWMRPPREIIKEVGASLIDKAKEERVLTLYAEMDTPDFENIMKPAFLRLYPWAEVNYVGLSTGELSSRVLSEYKAGKVVCDAFSMSLAPIMALKKAGAAEKVEIEMEKLNAYPASSLDPEGYWHVYITLPIPLMYNTQRVTPEETPKTYAELADPKWKGKIVFDKPSILNVAGPLFAHLYATLGNQTWTSLMQGIAANNPILTESASDAYNKVALGEAWIGIAMLNDYLAGKKLTPPAPVELTWPEPATTDNTYYCIAKDAPHPSMARLFLEWLASVDGQEACADTGRIPMHPMVASYTLLKGAVPAGVELVEVAINNPDFYQNPEKWATIFADIFG